MDRVPEVPIQVQTDILKTDRQFMGGKATRKDVRLRGASPTTIGREGIRWTFTIGNSSWGSQNVISASDGWELADGFSTGAGVASIACGVAVPEPLA